MLSKWFKGAKELAPLVIRIALGVVFFAHGSQKLFGAFGGHGITGVIGMMKSLNVNPPVVWAWIVTLAEFLGGLGVLFGLLTRWAALGLAVDMAVAIALVHAKNGFFSGKGGYEFPLALLAMSLALLFWGPGKISIEGAFRKELG
jgi:putative oxidoreductase